jgi:Flp pilus assembly protein TadD
MTPPLTSPSGDGQAPPQTPLSPLSDALEKLRQGPNDDAHLFPLLAVLAQTIGRADVEAEFQARAEYARTGQSPDAFRVTPAGADAPRLDGPALRANAAAADAYLQRGLDLFKEGLLDAAEKEYRWAVRLQPDLGEAYGNLGVLLARQKRLPEAEAAFRLAVQFQPTNVAAYTNLGTACLEQGRAAEAETWFRQATLIRPDLADGHRLLGTALETASKWKAAETAFRDALRLQPGLAECHYRLARVLKRQNQLAPAEAAYREAVRLRPDHVDGWNNLGVLLADQGRHADAEPCYRAAVRLQPNNPELHNNLGVALVGLERLDDAEASYREALRLQPDNAAAHNNLGNCLRQHNRLEDAAASLREAIRLKPSYAEAHNNLGIVLAHSGKIAEGMARYDEALRLRPDYPEAHLNRSLALLSTGDFARGWAEYEWRWKMPTIKPPKFKQPRWDGSPLAGRTVLLHAEQGLGDTIQFIRYASLLQALGGRVVLDCPVPLVELAASCPGVSQVVARGSALPPFDVWATLLSIPGLLHTTLETIPAAIPYVKADPERVRYWQQELASVPGLRVGISWQGSKQHRGDRVRSVPLTRFASLAKTGSVRLLSLQKGLGTEQLAEAAAAGWEVLDYGSRTEASFADTAALMLNLDLIVTVDSAVAHVAGALGLPVWVATPYAADWRWLRHREDTPWYPTLRLFRQPVPGDWDIVFQRLSGALTAQTQDQLQRQRQARV